MKPANLRATLALAMVPLALAACGSTSATSSSASPTDSSPAGTASPSGSAAAGTPLVGTATAMVAGKSETILVDAKGMTVYYRTSDTATNLCSGSCASVWPPLLLELGTATADSSIIANVSVLQGANGKQLAYKGHALYRYSKDSAAGDTNGNGIGNVWFAATVGLAAM